MANFHFELNKKGVGELMKSREMQSLLQEHAQRISRAAGSGHEQELYMASTRAVVAVSGSNERNALLKALMP